MSTEEHLLLYKQFRLRLRPALSVGNLLFHFGDLAVDALGFQYNGFKGDGSCAFIYLLIRP